MHHSLLLDLAVHNHWVLCVFDQLLRSAVAIHATDPDASAEIRHRLLPTHTGMQAAVQASDAERALRQKAEAKSNEAQADSDRRAASFHAAVRSAMAQAQGEVERERSDLAIQVQPLSSVAATEDHPM